MSHTPTAITADTKELFYEALHRQLAAILHGESDWICNLAQTSALLMEWVPDLNWVGFYLRKDDTLILGPFQGRVACTRIPIGKGVCGTAAADRRTVVVPDVHAFPGHIACDSRSQSEIVVPLIHHNSLLGVLDLDSPRLERFDALDAHGLETVAQIILNASHIP